MAVRRQRTKFRVEPFPASKIGIAEPVFLEQVEPVIAQPISYPQSVELTDIPVEPVTSLVPTVQGNQLTKRLRFGPNIRVRMRKQLTEHKKKLKAALRQCERDCKSLCNKKLKKTKKRTAKKSKKKPAKKYKKHAKA